MALIVLAASSAASTVRLPGAGDDVALGGQLALHHAEPALPWPGTPDGPPLGAPHDVTVAAPLGPHAIVPILYYHYIRNIQPTAQNLLSFQLSIPPALFAQQMALLHVEGAHPITLSTLMDALAGKRDLPTRPVVLTFDDGYADFATAVQPVMSRYGFVATDFVVSGFINRPRYMTAGQIQLMESRGMVIGAHTVHHVDLATVPVATARDEVLNSKSALERLLRHPVLDFAYPYGGFNSAVAQLVQEAGFREAVTTIGGDQQTLAGRFALHRTGIGGAPSLATFAAAAGVPLPTTAQFAVIAFLARQPAVARTA
ncbi:MAG: polysaccharide deacetylase family protein [Candidatus Dormibacteraeota bacterium]|nr:polysaccharide deacetylase family protein [Candidatus Dormibacteraeota bacterium]